MRTNVVVVTAPLLDDNAGLLAAAEPFDAQAFVPELAIEALVGAVLPRLGRVDVGGVDTGLNKPLEDRLANEFRAVVGSQGHRRPMHAHQAREDLDDPTRPDAPGHVDRQTLPGELVDDRQARY